MPDFSPSRLKAIKYRLEPESGVRATGSTGRQGSSEVLIYPLTFNLVGFNFLTFLLRSATAKVFTHD